MSNCGAGEGIRAVTWVVSEMCLLLISVSSNVFHGFMIIRFNDVAGIRADGKQTLEISAQMGQIAERCVGNQGGVQKQQGHSIRYGSGGPGVVSKCTRGWF